MTVRLLTALVGALLVVVGVSVVFVPAGLVVAGVLLIVVSWLLGDDPDL